MGNAVKLNKFVAICNWKFSLQYSCRNETDLMSQNLCKYQRLQRSEFKYFIPLSIRPFLLDDLSKFTTYDDFSAKKNGSYDVASIYFENWAMQAYHEKIGGQQNRVKLRFRFYPPFNEGDLINMELKIKDGMAGCKKRMKVCLKNFQEVCKFGISELITQATEIEGGQPFLLKRMASYRPFIRIDYRRTALVSYSDPNIRITLDQDIFCGRNNGDLENQPNIRFLPAETSILEIKSPFYFPFWLTTLIKKYSLSRSAISKYAFSTQKLAFNSTFSAR